MGFSISNVLSIASPGNNNNAAAANPQPAQNPPAAQVQPPVDYNADTVTLTLADQVYQLYNQGQSVSEIALTLRMSVDAVNNYLGITNSSQSASAA
jgi:DNA-binding NarL/FixJ family response regulator